jgi:phosphoglycerate dehydrogenase-like enzyme
MISLDGLVLTPHIASHASDKFDKTVRHMFGNIERFARGEPIPERDLVVAGG